MICPILTSYSSILYYNANSPVEYFSDGIPSVPYINFFRFPWVVPWLFIPPVWLACRILEIYSDPLTLIRICQISNSANNFVSVKMQYIYKSISSWGYIRKGKWLVWRVWNRCDLWHRFSNLCWKVLVSIASACFLGSALQFIPFWHVLTSILRHVVLGQRQFATAGINFVC